MKNTQQVTCFQKKLISELLCNTCAEATGLEEDFGLKIKMLFRPLHACNNCYCVVVPPNQAMISQ
jgi:hypothetical protein